jgi:tryptophan 7-halogenase
MRQIGDVSQFEILVVGGGTAGWLTANMLQALMNQPGRERFKITLVESPNTPRIGVGEATVPTLVQTLQDLGIPESLFLQRTHATFKHALRLEGWADGQDVYFHPFESFTQLRPGSPRDYLAGLAGLGRQQGMDPAALWWHRAAQGGASPFAYETSVQPWLCDARRGPRPIGAAEYSGKVPYAYHTNADLFADLLAEHGRARRIHHVRDDVTGVELKPDGDIAAVQTRNSGRIAADLFIDCTGFAAFLIGRTLGVPHVSFAEHLLCDRAMAMPVPATGAEPRPYTTCRALEAGWMWEIDLTNRTGAGHVYCSAFTSDERVEAVLRAQLGSRSNGVEPRVLRMNVGHREAMWKGNCVAVGLAAGFVEPLESTGIYLIEFGARMIAEYFATPRPLATAVQRYNALMTEQFEDLRDFIVLHYCLSKRQEPFWREVTQRRHIPDSVQEKLELWRSYFPSNQHLKQTAPLVRAENYQAILFGLGWRIEQPQGRVLLRRPLNLEAFEPELHAAVEKALLELPSHRDLIQSVIEGAGDDDAGQERAISLAFEAGIGLAGLARDPQRLRIAGGTCSPAEAGLDASGYHDGARVPCPPWRPPTARELEILRAEPSRATAASVVGVFEVPADTLARFAKALPRVSHVDDELVVHGGAEQALIDGAASELNALFSRDTGVPTHLGLLINRSGWATITGDKFDAKRIGLHFDSWSQLHLAQRNEAPNRVCVNLGTESRRLLFVNLSAARILQVLREHGMDVATMPPTDVARLFMRLCPDYPVVSVEVRPGEAYVAPTENIIHDGSSEGMRSADVTFTSIGRFDKFLAGEPQATPA